MILQVSVIGIIAVGVTQVIITSGIDLSSGSVVFNGEDVTKLRADQRLRRGLVLCPEGRGIFPGMTVTENLNMGAYARKDKDALDEDYDPIWGSLVKQTVKRVYPGFDETYYGYRNFSDLLEQAAKDYGLTLPQFLDRVEDG